MTASRNGWRALANQCAINLASPFAGLCPPRFVAYLLRRINLVVQQLDPRYAGAARPLFKTGRSSWPLEGIRR
jgi:hypothetical protein